jgi:hypothetical protein
MNPMTLSGGISASGAGEEISRDFFEKKISAKFSMSKSSSGIPFGKALNFNFQDGNQNLNQYQPSRLNVQNMQGAAGNTDSNMRGGITGSSLRGAFGGPGGGFAMDRIDSKESHLGSIQLPLKMPGLK